MKRRLSLYKKMKLFLYYRKKLQKNKFDLSNNFNIRIDNSLRMYTVLNIPIENIEEPYNLRKSDIDNLSKNYISEYSTKLSYYLDNIGLMELYDYYDVKKVDKYSYLVIFGFSLFKSNIFMRNLLIFLSGFLISLITTILIII